MFVFHGDLGYLASMLFSPRIKIKTLAGLCRRLATSLGAGVDVRTVWAREAEHATGRAARREFRSISQAVNRGESLAEALAATGEFFPTLFRELVAVGEQTGQLSEVLAQMADHYQNQLELRRSFLAVIAWPVLELGLSVLIVGFLIWILGVIGKRTGSVVDPFGIGVGNSGLLTYVALLGAVGLLFFVVFQGVRRGLVWTRPIQKGILRLPVLGKALATLALARMAWSLHLTMNTGMDVRRALGLSLRSTHNARYVDQIGPVDAEIVQGNSIHEALAKAGDYPADFLDTLAVGEQSGRLVESMGRLARQYNEQARFALSTLSKLAGLGVWIAIMLILVVLIMRVFLSLYLAPINDLLDKM